MDSLPGGKLVCPFAVCLTLSCFWLGFFPLLLLLLLMFSLIAQQSEGSQLTPVVSLLNRSGVFDKR